MGDDGAEMMVVPRADWLAVQERLERLEQASVARESGRRPGSGPGRPR
jgi:hypothetical protein